MFGSPASCLLTQADLTAITSASLATAARGAAGYSWEAGQSKQVLYTTDDGHLHELFVAVGGKWGQADLTALTSAPSAFRIVGYGWEAGRSKQVVYTASDSHIHELFIAVGGKWGHADLTTLTGAPSAKASVASGYGWEAGRSKQVLYTTSDGHIHELFVAVGGKWGHADLTAITGAPLAFQSPSGYSWEAGRSKQVIYQTEDGHIHELSVAVGGKWGHADLTTLTGAPLAQEIIDGYSWEAGRSKQVAYIARDDHHIHELFVAVGGGWGHANLTALTDAPLVGGGGAFGASGYSWEAGRSKQVVYTTSDRHLHELFVAVGGKWGHADLTALTGAPLVIDGPA